MVQEAREKICGPRYINLYHPRYDFYRTDYMLKILIEINNVSYKVDISYNQIMQLSWTL